MVVLVRVAAVAACFLGLAPSVCAAAGAAANGCDEAAFQRGFYFAGAERRFDEETFFADAHKLDIPLYKERSGDARYSPLVFSRRYGIVDPGEGLGRLRIRDPVSGSPAGWVDRNDVLCRRRPLADTRTGLYRRASIRTEAELAGRPQAAKIYQSPDHRCENSACVEVSRFQWYFIYGEEQDHYLISEDANLAARESRLLGWLPKADVLEWNTALGLRPAEELAHVAPGQTEKFVCAYRTREDLDKGMNCHPILGGERWFGISARLAILNQDSEVYEVAFPGAFTGSSASAPRDQIHGTGVFRAYVKATEPVVPEVLLSKDQLEKWIKILDLFSTFANTPGNQKRRLLVNTLLAELGVLLATDFESTATTLGEMIQMRGGIADAARSVLLRYSPEELLDQTKVPNCEIEFLAQYAAMKRRVLNIVYASDGRLMAEFKMAGMPPGHCPSMADKGRRVPLITSEPVPKAINSPSQQTTYRISHLRGDEIFFWIPVGYLP